MIFGMLFLIFVFSISAVGCLMTGQLIPGIVLISLGVIVLIILIVKLIKLARKNKHQNKDGQGKKLLECIDLDCGDCGDSGDCGGIFDCGGCSF